MTSPAPMRVGFARSVVGRVPVTASSAALRLAERLVMPRRARPVVGMVERLLPTMPSRLRDAIDAAGGPSVIEQTYGWTERYAPTALAAVLAADRGRWDRLIAHSQDRVCSLVEDDVPTIVVHPHMGSMFLPQPFLVAHGARIVSFVRGRDQVRRLQPILERVSGIPMSTRMEWIEVPNLLALRSAEKALASRRLFFWQVDSVANVAQREAGRHVVATRMLGFGVHAPTGLYEVAHRTGARVVLTYDLLLSGARPRFRLALEPVDADLGSAEAWFGDIYRAVDAALYQHVRQWKQLVGWLKHGGPAVAADADEVAV